MRVKSIYPMFSSIKTRMKSFEVAFEGIYTVMKMELHFRIHVLAACVVFGLALYLEISRFEWCLLVITVFMVCVSEMFNTAIEVCCDAVSHEFHPLIKQAKDIAAGAVLLSALMSIVMAGFIFLPYLD